MCRCSLGRRRNSTSGGMTDARGSAGASSERKSARSALRRSDTAAPARSPSRCRGNIDSATHLHARRGSMCLPRMRRPKSGASFTSRSCTAGPFTGTPVDSSRATAMLISGRRVMPPRLDKPYHCHWSGNLCLSAGLAPTALRDRLRRRRRDACSPLKSRFATMRWSLVRRSATTKRTVASGYSRLGCQPYSRSPPPFARFASSEREIYAGARVRLSRVVEVRAAKGEAVVAQCQ
jgi:hypothetical protein